MKAFSVGPDDYDVDLHEVKADNYVWMVYWYECGGYDGDGVGVALRKSDGMLATRGLSHCSCYGGWDGWETGADIITVAEFLRPKESIHDLDFRKEVKDKVTALLVEAGLA